MRTLIANKALTYGSRNYAANEEFRASNAHCRVLVASGLARETVAGPAVKQPPTPTQTTTPSKRVYRRRDLTAERD